ncbi:hypothetical protein [Wolbachia endosymbiont of Psylliodes chrysocephala]|uniref:hypothetical protein n=1 Tax=Wolbachia endosymbiont of Psylliodes chrysocephala TaxID=2883236 RepID=UPI0020A06636|nr:hypothetical protein [Wolbachia endosymbiont of Psylliodes chrysocephala]
MNTITVITRISIKKFYKIVINGITLGIGITIDFLGKLLCTAFSPFSDMCGGVFYIADIRHVDNIIIEV